MPISKNKKRTKVGPLLIKHKTKKSQKRLGRPPRDYKLYGFISLLNALQKKPRCQKNLGLYFENFPLKRVHYAEVFEKFQRLADELVCDDDDLLENCHRLSETFETLQINKRADNVGRYGEFHHSATPKAGKDSKPNAEEEDIDWMETSCLSLNVDEDESEEFFKACLRSAKKIAVPKMAKDSRSMRDLFTAPNLENEVESDPSNMSICNDSIDDIYPKPLGESQANPAEIKHDKLDIVQAAKLPIVPKPLEDYPERINTFTKQPEEKSEKVPENLQIVSKPAQKIKEMPDIVQNPPEKLLDSKPLEKNTEKIELVSKQLDKNTDKTDLITKQQDKITETNKLAYKPTEKTPENVQNVPKPAEKKVEKPDIVPNPPEKLIDPLEKKSEEVKLVYKPTNQEVRNYEICLKKPEEGKSSIGTQAMKDFRFSTAEKKRVGTYNSNMFNPAGKWEDPGRKILLPLPNRRNIILDGSNVAFSHGRNCFSSKGLKYCLQYFQRMGHWVKAVVPLFRRNAFQSTDPRIIDELYRNGNIVFTPCKNFHGQKSASYDDRFILQLAYEWNAIVVSNDNYRDLIDENPAFRMIVETRVLGYTWCDDIFILPKDPYGRRGPTLDQILYF